MLRATGIDNTGRYLLFFTTAVAASPERISSTPKHVSWLPDQTVNTNDYILIYTTTGLNRQFKNDLGTTTYVFYLDQTKTQLNNPLDSVALMAIDAWEFKSKS